MPLSKGGGSTGGSGTVTSVTATDTSVVVAGTAAAPTIATATLDVIATVHPPAASVPMNARKITGLANGAAAQDAAAFGQIPAVPVASVFTRTGAVVAAAGDYTGVAVGGTADALAALALTNAMVSASAAIAQSKLAAMTNVDATMAGDVTQVSANTFYDGPAGVFAAGTWLIVWKLGIVVNVATNQSYFWTAKLWDGTTVYDETEISSIAAAQNGAFYTMSGLAITTLAGSATLKVSCASIRGSSGSILKRDTTDNSATSHFASRLSGVKIG